MILAVRHSLLVILLGVLTFASVNARTVARLYLDSEPGAFVGHGLEHEVYYRLPQDRLAARIAITLPDGTPTAVSFVFDSSLPGDPDGSLYFGTHALGIPILPGYYSDARRFSSAPPGHPGLSVTFKGRAPSRLDGEFTIRSIGFFTDTSGPVARTQISHFDATFTQYTDFRPEALHGRFTYHVDGLAAIPIPGALVLLLSAVGVLAFGARRPREH